MITNSWFLDAMLYIYALSLMFTFSDFIQRNPSAKRTGTGLLLFVWSMQTIFLVSKQIHSGNLIVFSTSDSLFLFAWLLITLSLVLSLLIHIEFVLFLASMAGFIITTLASLNGESIAPLAANWEIRDDLLWIHISLAIGSYAAFFCSAIFSGMLLFLYAGLKRKQYSVTIRRLPSLDRIQQYATRAVMIGTPLLMLSLVLGIVWIILENAWPLLLDVKVIASSLILIIYCIYLLIMWMNKMSWTRMAVLNLLAFLFVFFNYITTNWLSNFH